MPVSIKQPVRALCSNRASIVQEHPVAGSPNDWFTLHLLRQFQLVPLGFHFFVNHTEEKLYRDFWLKRLVATDEPEGYTDALKAALKPAFERWEDATSLQAFGRLGKRVGMRTVSMLVPDVSKWSDDLRIFWSVIAENGAVNDFASMDTETLKEAIKTLSGGRTRTRKRLGNAETTLECYLAESTESLWPTDVDCVLVDPADSKPRTLLEFKKCNDDNTPISDQTFTKYYGKDSNGKWLSDKRKYDNLAILREALGSDVPFVIVYYPVKTIHTTVKVDLVQGGPKTLQPAKTRMLPLPGTDDASREAFVREVLKFAGVLAE